MIKVLVFFNAESCKVMTVLEGISSIRQEYPNGEETYRKRQRSTVWTLIYW